MINSNKGIKGWVISVLGGIIASVLFFGLQFAATKYAPPKDTITTSGGMVVKMGKVLAELPQSMISVGSGVDITVPLGTEAIEMSKLLNEAGIKDTQLLSGNLTVCIASVVAYKTELNGYISTAINKECRNFTPGMMAATIKTFAEDYNKHVVSEYKTKYNYLKGASK